MITLPVRSDFGPALRVRLPIGSGAERPLRGNPKRQLSRPTRDMRSPEVLAGKRTIATFRFRT
jgi:hypothetical protein